MSLGVAGSMCAQVSCGSSSLNCGVALAQAGSPGGCVLEVDPQALGAQALKENERPGSPTTSLPPPLPPDLEPVCEPWAGAGARCRTPVSCGQLSVK